LYIILSTSTLFADQKQFERSIAHKELPESVKEVVETFNLIFEDDKNCTVYNGRVAFGGHEYILVEYEILREIASRYFFTLEEINEVVEKLSYSEVYGHYCFKNKSCLMQARNTPSLYLLCYKRLFRHFKVTNPNQLKFKVFRHEYGNGHDKVTCHTYQSVYAVSTSDFIHIKIGGPCPIAEDPGAGIYEIRKEKKVIYPSYKLKYTNKALLPAVKYIEKFLDRKLKLRQKPCDRNDLDCIKRTG
jgi:hypothetical protein